MRFEVPFYGFLEIKIIKGGNAAEELGLVCCYHSLFWILGLLEYIDSGDTVAENAKT